MQTVLFIMVPIPSHYNANYGLANWLQQHNYRIVYAGTPSLKQHVEEQGFDFKELTYLIEYFPAGIRTKLHHLWRSLRDSSHLRTRYRDYRTTLQSLQALCDQVRPDYILIDEHLSYYYYLLHDKAPNVFFIHSKPPTQPLPAIPPLEYAVPLQNNLLGRLRAWAMWQPYLLRRHIGRLQRRAIFLGKNDMYFVERHARRNGLDPSTIAMRNNALYDLVKGVQRLHIVPRCLEYPWYKPAPNEHFFRRPYERHDARFASTNWQSIEPILDKRAREGHRLLYVSLGTLSKKHADLCVHFLNQVIEAVRPLHGVQVIMVTNKLDIHPTENTPPHVHLMPSVPQQRLLLYCDLMLTHGGMNSVTECLVAGVPMLVYPLNLTSDQPGNAARVRFHGLGLAGTLRRASSMRLRQQIEALLGDPAYHERVELLGQQFAAEIREQERSILPVFGYQPTPSLTSPHPVTAD
ncbi:putative UDP-glucosyltransferase ydhE [Fibrisoma limi BUZ 3]|uniref:Putative UDP-glucosyltransferase ydhE n=2 Tax=Fibrisoma limi TaxID=663275 RepID=I2GPQ3_9BACT|nr:putative UDP-glucosyltransferase ydhE [Fibrisoma limi BUZ 3]